MLIIRISAKTSSENVRAILQGLGSFPEEMLLTITYDNGSENAKHSQTNKALECDS